MSVEDWARREAEAYWSSEWLELPPPFVAGAMALADRLLSDEAVRALSKRVALHVPGAQIEFRAMRAALQAAIDAVTEEGN